MNDKQQKAFGFSEQAKTSRPVECLGRTFASDEVRREYYLKMLAEKLEDEEFRNSSGFPLGTNQAIVGLSDPPYYTACPNPFIGDFVRYHGRQYDPNEEYSIGPFASDISEGKGDPLYSAHSYHTKVPPRAILKYILHYTKPGDLILDGFAGTGMTAIAAQLAGTPDVVEHLKLEAGTNSSFMSGDAKIEGGNRFVIANDLSPIAGFIGRGLMSQVSAAELEREALAIVDEVEREYGWLYEVIHGDSGAIGKLTYAVWSDHLLCSSCDGEIDAYDVVVDLKNSRMNSEFRCPHCDAALKRRSLQKVKTTKLDPILGVQVTQPKQTLKRIQYKVGKASEQRLALDSDLLPIKKAEEGIKGHSVPTCSMEHTWQHLRDGNHIKNITHSHHYFSARNLLALSALRDRALKSKYSIEMLFVLTGFVEGHANKRNRFIVDRHHPKGTTCGPLSNTLFLPEVQCEVNVFDKWRQTLKKQLKAWKIKRPRTAVSQTSSATSIAIPDMSVDYIFVDPPFGKNIMYSELNHLYEVWLGVMTRPDEEAIVNDVQGKDVDGYRELMAQCFAEFFRVLKPGRWLTLEFHNSQNAVWTAMQEALIRAGFVVADVRVLDKRQGTLHQDSGYTVKKDLIVSAYRPSEGVHANRPGEGVTENSVWDFVRGHLEKLPVFLMRGGVSEVSGERQGHLLFDRMVAFHVQRNIPVPLSFSEFIEGLEKRFVKRDSMYFLSGQVTEYDRKRTTVGEIRQLSLFVFDEASATQWVRQQLQDKPQSFQELQPQYLQQLQSWAKHEIAVELKEILQLNFFCYEGNGPVPGQIRNYLSKNYRAFRNLEEDDAALKSKATGRWYVPDPNKEGDLEKLRLRTLLKEFEEYRLSKTRKIKKFRTEAVRAGFKSFYDQGDYQTIVEVAAKLDDKIIQEDEKLLMYYDVATMRLGM